MKIYYGKAVYGKEEINAAIKVLKNKSLTLIDGPSVKKLEKTVANIFGKKYGLMVNSGSSANLLALASLRLRPGSEIITPTLTFSTTVSPIYQLGYKAHFIDVGENNFVADHKQIEECINKNTSAIMIPNLLGNLPEWDKIYKIAKKYKLKIIEDSADTIGYSYKKKIGKYSDITTNSMYASHIVTGAGFGGIACFNDFTTYTRAKLLRGWGRSSATFNESEGIKERFSSKVDGIPYDGKYIFSDMGYNFLPSEISAAFALEQVKNLKKNFSNRVKNFKYLKKFLSKYNHYFDLPIQDKFVKTCWLAFPLIVKKNNFFNRNDLQVYLEKNQIQTRVIFSGNILKQPLMKDTIYTKIKNCDVESNHVMQNGILIGCHHGLTASDLKYITDIFSKFLKAKLK